MIEVLGELGAFLLEHADLIDDVIAAVESGAPKDAIRVALRRVKIEVSDAAIKEELGL